jgi:hypothetical protein
VQKLTPTNTPFTAPDTFYAALVVMIDYHVAASILRQTLLFWNNVKLDGSKDVVRPQA